MPVLTIFVYFWLLIATLPAFALDENDAFLPPEQAFIITASATSEDNIAVTWHIADGYSVYRNNLRVLSNTDSISVAQLIFPDGQVKHDEILGDIEKALEYATHSYYSLGKLNFVDMDSFIRTSEYISELNQRKKDITLLKKQLGEN
jgi:thiol:disulfide interchange protein